MLMNQVYGSKAPSLVGRAFVSGPIPSLSRPNPAHFLKGSAQLRRGRVTANSVKAEAVQITATEAASTVTATVSVQVSVGGLLSNLGLSRGLDDVADFFGKTLLLELISSDLDPRTGTEKEALIPYAHKISKDGKKVEYEAELTVPSDFGEVGAVVENEHHKEMHLNSILLSGLPLGDLHLTCNSWVHSKFDNPHKRIFFNNKSYLPSQTPEGLKKLRKTELQVLRGDGSEERKSIDRIYDYDTYNDLGDPDNDSSLKRPVLGGKQQPYPRCCRTGRSRCKTDPLSDKRSSSVYVPRDEQFSEVKGLTFSATTLYSVLHELLPSLETALIDSNLGFPYFTAIDSLYNEGVNLPSIQKFGLKDILPRIVHAVSVGEEAVLRFQTPAVFERTYI